MDHKIQKPSIWLIAFFFLFFLNHPVYCQLSYKFYDGTCPNLTGIVRSNVWSAIRNDTRMAASLLRLHFHDCFVNGCDGSVLLDDTNDFQSEKNALGNRNSARGFEVIDKIKAAVESVCPSTVSCADILTLASRDSVLAKNKENIRAEVVSALFQAKGVYISQLLHPVTTARKQLIIQWTADVARCKCCGTEQFTSGQPLISLRAGGFSAYYMVPLGRRDGTTASEEAANEQLPSPFESLQNITTKFTSKGLTLKDVVVLTGAHTIGFAQCFTFSPRLSNFGGSGMPDPSLDSSLLSDLQSRCPDGGPTDTLAPLDRTTVDKFDNAFYKNLLNNSGLLQSDQALMGDTDSASMVSNYSKYPYLFFKDFGASMVKMANIGVLTGQNGQIRNKCNVVN